MIINLQTAQEELNYIVDLLVEHANFTEFLSGNKSITTWWGDNDEKIPDEIMFESGCTRVVFFLSSCPEYVFKCNKPFHRIDYNAQEYQVYQLAREAKVDNWFCPVDWIQPKEWSINFLCSPYIDVNEDDLSDQSCQHQISCYCAEHDLNWETASLEQQEEVYSDIDDYYETTSGILDFMYSIYDFKAVRNLECFINTHGINDLHPGNWGEK